MFKREAKDLKLIRGFISLQVKALLRNSNITVIQQCRGPWHEGAPWDAPVILLKRLVLLHTLFLTLCLNRVKRQVFISYRIWTHWAVHKSQVTELCTASCPQAVSRSAFQFGSGECFWNFHSLPLPLSLPLDSPHKLDCCLMKAKAFRSPRRAPLMSCRH